MAGGRAAASLLLASLALAAWPWPASHGQLPQLPYVATPLGYVPHAPIHIEEDTGPLGLELAPGVPNVAMGVTGGDGSAVDPYVIEGWLISSYEPFDGSSTGNAAISLRETSKFVVVRDNYLTCYLPPDRCGGGVRVVASRNVVVERNVIDHAGVFGAFLAGALSGTQVHNVHLRENQILGHTWLGVFVHRLNFSTVEGNYVAGNREGANAFSSYGTVWRDNDIQGNGIGLFNSGKGIAIAEDNWWGSAAGPQSCTNPTARGNSVTCNVDHTPWATSPRTEWGS